MLVTVDGETGTGEKAESADIRVVPEGDKEALTSDQPVNRAPHDAGPGIKQRRAGR